MTNNQHAQRQPHTANLIVGTGVRIVVFLVFIALVLFLTAGRLDWWMAWVVIGAYAVALAATSFIIGRRSPDLLAERAQLVREDAQNWDKLLSLTVRLSFAAAFVVSGLDARYGWTTLLSPAIQILALLMGLLASGMIAWSMASNSFFAVYARIQEERGHAVATTGPYRLMRHPGYLGMTLLALMLPVALGSVWALIPGGLAALLFITKTALEDRMLREELPGYAEYAQRVHYRLLPGIW
jgi:protein-S-isoprenylcysteine O-methyltransferase Ste14